MTAVATGRTETTNAWWRHPLTWLAAGLAAMPMLTSALGMTDVAATKLAIFVLVATGSSRADPPGSPSSRLASTIPTRC